MKQLARAIPFAVAIVCAACGTSDESVTTELRTQLSKAAADTSQVAIETKGQVITLSGTVASAAERDEITRVVRQSAGGKDVIDKMTVRQAPAAAVAPGTSQPTAGAPIETAVATVPAESSGGALSNAASATGDAVTTAAKATGNAVVDASKATANATVKGAEAVADSKVGEATTDAAKATGNATVKGAEATASGAKKLGSGIAGAFGGGKDSNSDKK